MFKKVSLFLTALFAFATSASAQVAVDSSTGVLSGSIDMAGYNSAMAIMIPVVVTILVGGIILRTLSRKG
jgi:ABC-type Fe3+-siderophore transport system permease subunit